MASWMIHLRIADQLLDRIPGLSPIEFIMGNMAPDSGVPNEDWSAFSPSTAVSHYRTDNGTGKKAVNPAPFIARYFTAERRAAYTPEEYSFYLGYLTHLMTDVHWSAEVADPARKKYAPEFAAHGQKFWNVIKEDWYDLDFLYLKNHPGFRAFRAYLGSVGFVNRYLDFFSPDAFDNRRQYITDFYLQPREGLERAYPYLTQEQADKFVADAVQQILSQLGGPALNNYPMNNGEV